MSAGASRKGGLVIKPHGAKRWTIKPFESIKAKQHHFLASWHFYGRPWGEDPIPRWLRTNRQHIKPPAIGFFGQQRDPNHRVFGELYGYKKQLHG
jgi:hypothetical protein